MFSITLRRRAAFRRSERGKLTPEKRNQAAASHRSHIHTFLYAISLLRSPRFQPENVHTAKCLMPSMRVHFTIQIDDIQERFLGLMHYLTSAAFRHHSSDHRVLLSTMEKVKALIALSRLPQRSFSSPHSLILLYHYSLTFSGSFSYFL